MIVGNVEEIEEEEGTGTPGCRSKCWAREDRRDESYVICEVIRDEFRKIHRDQRDELTKIREGRRDGLMKIRDVRKDGFVLKPKRKQCKRQEKTDEITSATIVTF